MKNFIKNIWEKLIIIYHKIKYRHAYRRIREQQETYVVESYKHTPKDVVFIKSPYIPERKTEGAAAYDLVANIPSNFVLFKAGETHIIPTGVHIEIPKGKCGLLLLRSSLATSTTLEMANGVGLIDSDYRGEIKVPLRNTSFSKRATINKGDRIAQLLIVDFYAPTLVQTKELGKTERNEGGFGSTGAK